MNPTQDATLKTRPEQMDFEARRLHNLPLFYEHSRDMQERLRSAELVARALRRYLVRFYRLEARS